MTRYLAALVLALGLTLTVGSTGCASATVSTPAPVQPNSPQSTVALLNKSVADTNLAGIKTVITLRDAGKLSQANTRTIQDWQEFIARTNKSIGLILVKPEPWSTQKSEILALLVTVTAPQLVGVIDTQAQAVVSGIMTLVNQIREQVRL